MKICPECQREYDANTKFCLEDGTRTVERDKVEEDPLIGQFVDKDRQYQILEVLGAGGMGKVYKGRQEMMNREVAIKTLHKELLEKPEIEKRFRREALAAAKLKHQHAIEVFTFGQLDAPGKPYHDMPYMVMEFVSGRSLHEEITGAQKLDQTTTVQIMLQVCGVLEEAHSQGVIHRDLKPENIVLTERSRNKHFVKVLDFGIAKLLQEEEAGATKLTQAGSVFGTPQYLSPEQASGTPVDARSDIYSLGIILYEMLTGKVPFHADTAVGFLLKHVSEEPQPIRQFAPEAGISPAMESIVMKALAKDPNERHQSVSDMIKELEALKKTAQVPQPGGMAATMMHGGSPPGMITPPVAGPGVPQTSPAYQTAPPVVQPQTGLPHQSKTPTGPGTLEPQVIYPNPTPSGGGKGLWIACGVVALLLGAGGLYFAFAPNNTSQNTPDNTATASLGTQDNALELANQKDTPSTETPDTPVETPKNTAENTVPTITTPKEEKVTLSIKTKPRGIEVLLDGEFIGLTPIKHTVVKSDLERTLTLQKEGFEPKERSIVINADKDLDLDVIARRGRPGKIVSDKPQIKPANTKETRPKKNPTDQKKVLDIMGKRKLGGG